jgi:hypothetical protein
MKYEDFVEELMSKLPKIEEGMKFEVLTSFFPDSDISSSIRNVDNKFTKPLALSAKDKNKIRRRDENILQDFLNYKNTKKEKGDILIVKESHNGFALCENISRPKEVNEKYYNANEIKYVKITLRDILEGNIKRVQRIRSSKDKNK